MSGKTCSKCCYLLVAAGRHKGCLTLSSNAEACKDFRGVSVFDRITASPEVLAEKLVYHKKYMVQDGVLQYWVSSYFSTIIKGKSWEYESEAIAATVEKLKETER